MVFNEETEEFIIEFLNYTRRHYERLKKENYECNIEIMEYIKYTHDLFLEFAKILGYEGNDIID